MLSDGFVLSGSLEVTDTGSLSVLRILTPFNLSPFWLFLIAELLLSTTTSSNGSKSKGARKRGSTSPVPGGLLLGESMSRLTTLVTNMSLWEFDDDTLIERTAASSSNLAPPVKLGARRIPPPRNLSMKLMGRP